MPVGFHKKQKCILKPEKIILKIKKKFFLMYRRRTERGHVAPSSPDTAAGSPTTFSVRRSSRCFQSSYFTRIGLSLVSPHFTSPCSASPHALGWQDARSLLPPCSVLELNYHRQQVALYHVPRSRARLGLAFPSAAVTYEGYLGRVFSFFVTADSGHWCVGPWHRTDGVSTSYWLGGLGQVI